MKTPFDAALVIQHRAIADLRRAIGAQTNALVEAETSQARHEATVARERRLATELGLPTHNYFEHQRAAGRQLTQDRTESETMLATLREQATAHYGATRAIESAAADWRSAAERTAAAKAQAQIDDFAASRFVQSSKTEAAARRRDRDAPVGEAR